VVKSICPYCAVGCGQDVYVRDGQVVQIEGDADSPVSRGRFCSKGSASLQLTTGSARRIVAGATGKISAQRRRFTKRGQRRKPEPVAVIPP
jgi:hypothetical protein